MRLQKKAPPVGWPFLVCGALLRIQVPTSGAFAFCAYCSTLLLRLGNMLRLGKVPLLGNMLRLGKVLRLGNMFPFGA